MLVTLLRMLTLVRPAAAIECVIPDAGDAVGNDDARQACSFECVIPDAGDAVGDGDARQASDSLGMRHRPMLVTLSGMVMLVRLVQSRMRYSRCW